MGLISGFLRRGVEKFERDARAWGITLPRALVIAAIPVAIVLALTAMVPFFTLFVWITAEDSVIEWAQFLMLFSASLIFAWMSIRLLRGRQRITGLLYLAAALGAFFVAGEEIAWGQRIFGWGTPEALGAVNYQNETTLHNISSAHQAFIYAVALVGLYGAVAPLLGWLFWKERPRSLLSYLLVPPLCLAPAFIMVFGYRFGRQWLQLDERFPRLIFPITKFSEVTELCLYFGIAVFAWLNLSRLRQKNRFRIAEPFPEESSIQSTAQ